MDVLNLPIDTVGLSVRAQNALLRMGFRVIGDLKGYTEKDLYDIPNIGKKTVDEILLMMDKYIGHANHSSSEESTAASASSPESICLIGLSNRSMNALLRAGYRTVDDLMRCTQEELFNISNLGAKSVDEILNVIENLKDKRNHTTDTVLPVDQRSATGEELQKSAVEYLKETKVEIAQVEALSAKAYNVLLFGGYEYLYQVVSFTEEQFLEIPHMDHLTAQEISTQISLYLEQNKAKIFAYKRTSSHMEDIILNSSLLFSEKYQQILREYITVHDILLDNFGLSKSICKKLKNNGYKTLLDIAFVRPISLRKKLNLAPRAVEEIGNKINEYIRQNGTQIKSACRGSVEVLWDDESLKNRILAIFNTIAFDGLSLQELIDKLSAPIEIDSARIKRILGFLIQEGTLEYIDFRCYRVYPKFEDYLTSCDDIEPRNKEIIGKRLRGDTLEEIAQEYDLTRERVRQIVAKQIDKIRLAYSSTTGLQYFDEDYYRYIYTNYCLDKKDSIKWLGLTQPIWQYLESCGLKAGKKDLHEALDDRKNLETALRLKIRNYLNRDKIYIADMWVEKRRSALEEVVIKRFCQEDTTFTQFTHIYNEFLEHEDIPYDETLYYTEDVYRTRKNRLSEARFLLWKQNETIRAYDVDGRDYTELLQELNFDSYENIEISTEKLIREHLALMQRYDIRDRYELHNLLKKIVEDGAYHNFHCCRTPDIRFGTFDKKEAIFNIMAENSPVSQEDLIQAVSDEYGYDAATIMGTYLPPLSAYAHQGVYTIRQKVMGEESMRAFKAALTSDFYYFDELRKIYSDLFPHADTDEVNPYNLKKMGFVVLSKYAVQNYPSLESYCEHLLTSEDMVDIKPYKKRFASVVMFSQKLMELKRNLTVIEYEPDKLLNFRKLESAGITRENICEFCDSVYRFIPDGTYFSAHSLRLWGFKSHLYDLGFEDWFYANLLISDERFSFGNMFGTLVLYKGQEFITIKSFERTLIQAHESIDVLDLMNELESTYGCNNMEKTDLIYKVQGTEIYYDNYLERFYANENLYYRELDESDGV